MLDKVIHFIVHKRKIIEIFFAVAVVLSLCCAPFVGTNYDLSVYLPTSVPSKVGLDLMEEEFGYPGTARVMIEDVSLYEAKVMKDRIENVHGVDMVSWADSVVDIYQTDKFIHYQDIEDYYKDGYACMDVIFVGGDYDTETYAALDEIKEITGERGHFSGPAVENKSLSETLASQVAIAAIIAVIFIAAILLATTTSWFEPILFLFIMGVAILINLGTNIFLGTVSFLTFSVGAILQLAVAMDYSIFLLHSFTREKSYGLSSEQAIENALKSSVSSILSSGATTFVGFIVLTFMRFTIGRDLGIVLAKGIVISLITVLFLMPALILRWDGLIERTSHRSFMPSFRGFAQWIYRLRVPILIGSILIVVPCYVGQTMNQYSFGNQALGNSEGTVAYEDNALINEHFGQSNLLMAIIPNTSMVTERQLTEEIEDLYYVNSVTGLAGILPEGIPVDFLPEHIVNMLQTEDYARILIRIRTSSESPLAYSCTDEIRSIVEKYYPGQSHIVGNTPSTQDIEETIIQDYSLVNLLSLIGVAVVVLITFRSIIIPIVVMIPIEAAIFMNMAMPYIAGETMMYLGYIIVSCIQLGATIDYSILLTTNYLNAREEMNKKDSVIDAVEKSALSILTSGSILTTVGYGLYFTSSVVAIADMGRLIGRGALFSMAMVLGFLPALLLLFDRFIFNQKKRLDRLIAKRRTERENKSKTEDLI